MLLKNCKICNKQIQVNRKDTLYCPECKKKVNSKKVMQSRKRKHPEIEIGVGSGNNSKNRGITHGSYTTGITAYRKFIKTNKCSKCDSKINLLVHHIDNNRLNNIPSNLICLCKKCHQKIHWNQRKQFRDSKGRFITKLGESKSLN